MIRPHSSYTISEKRHMNIFWLRKNLIEKGVNVSNCQEPSLNNCQILLVLGCLETVSFKYQSQFGLSTKYQYGV